MSILLYWYIRKAVSSQPNIWMIMSSIVGWPASTGLELYRDTRQCASAGVFIILSPYQLKDERKGKAI